MGRSLYLGDEYRDVQGVLFGAFRHAQNGEWGEARYQFEDTRKMLEQLENLMAAVELGEVDPNRKESLAHPSRRNDWCEVSDLAE